MTRNQRIPGGQTVKQHIEAQRQRAAAGMYDRCRLDKDTCQRLLFEWGYRRLAETYHPTDCRRLVDPWEQMIYRSFQV